MSQNIAKASAPHHAAGSANSSSKIVELFLSTIIHGKDLDFYLRVMQGVCGMQPNHNFRRQVVFEGPRDRKLLGVPAPLMKQRNLVRALEWTSLHEPLSRQAYYLTASWDVAPSQFGRKNEQGEFVDDSGIMDLNQLFGTLRWAEWADASAARQMNSRQIVHIENEKNLFDAMRLMHHGLWAENVRETHQFVHDNVVIEFSRYFYLPGQLSNPIKTISPRLPPREELIPYGGQIDEGKWLVTAYRLVLVGTDQELMQEGVQELQAFQELVKESLDLKMIKTNERHDIDPRVK